MKRALAWTVLGLIAAGLTGCDEGGTPVKTSGAGGPASFDAAAPQNIPEPARFAKPGPPPADPAPSAAVRQVAFAAVPAAPSPSLERVSFDAGKAFDAPGSRPAVSVAAVRPAPKPGVRANSPVPDRVENGALIFENRQFAVDTDGWIADPARRRRVTARDRDHQDGTAFYAGGRPLDPTVVPYISIPGDFRGARKGDLARVCRGARCAWAVIGDVGPDGRFGEGSVALAERLGINPDGNDGGLKSGVSYEIYPGRKAPRDLGSTRLAAYLGGGLPGSFVLASL